MTTKTLTALEDIDYRVGSSYPKEGWFIPKGGTLQVCENAVKLLSVRKHRTKQRGRFKLEDKC